MGHRNAPIHPQNPSTLGSDDADRSRAARGSSGYPPGRASGGLDVPVIQITEFDPVVEQHPIPLPIEAIGEDDPARGRLGNVGEIRDGSNRVSQSQVDLTGVRLCQ
jgi:hypothetical protein